ncbi:TetR/AcrR family transcriptional regulator [Ruminococcus sp. OA3]|uniref:TetR/AcrR family transcriptional regulator n=1 Tax=Ruminococcus sp. OA3 TaxID=2914164 RepID=UPI001F053C15|nr:TetR/AcrR family transcriptional regulator [Ruminococcus sp. OA3]MCH1983012.1 TetR/AcrR family transcriptional regulator [Ruminococcus sp. OA3]
MAKQIEGVYEQLLECAKHEFLVKGFKDASLRTIAANAGTSTNSIYVRFQDKEGLFEAIVEPVVSGVLQLFCEIQETFHEFEPEIQKARVNEYSFKEMDRFLDYIYGNLDEFRLLLDASHGTRFQNFVDELTRVEVEYTYKYMEVAGYMSAEDGEVTGEFLHMVTTAYFEGVFEVVRHGMDRGSAGRYVRMLERYHAAGFDTFFIRDNK